MAVAEPTPHVARPHIGPLRVRTRILIGILGGFSAILLKLYAHDKGVVGEWVLQLWRGSMTDENLTFLFGYAVAALLVMFLGGLIGYFVEETNRLKMLALGLSAPAVLTTLAGGIEVEKSEAGPADRIIEAPTEGPAGRFIDHYGFVGTAYAQQPVGTAPVAQLGDGVQVFFGLRPVIDPTLTDEGSRYWVIVGSERDPENAEAIADSLNQRAPELNAFVGARKPGNEYYPIIIGGPEAFVPYREALELRDNAIEAGVAPADSYLSDFPDRLPPLQ